MVDQILDKIANRKGYKDWVEFMQANDPHEIYQVTREAVRKALTTPRSVVGELHDTLSKRPVKMWFADQEGNYYIDHDPHGLDMSGKRTIHPAGIDRYQFVKKYEEKQNKNKNQKM